MNRYTNFSSKAPATRHSPSETGVIEGIAYRILALVPPGLSRLHNHHQKARIEEDLSRKGQIFALLGTILEEKSLLKLESHPNSTELSRRSCRFHLHTAHHKCFAPRRGGFRLHLLLGRPRGRGVQGSKVLLTRSDPKCLTGWRTSPPYCSRATSWRRSSRASHFETS